VDHDEIAVCPDVVVFFKVGSVIFGFAGRGRGGIVPEVDGHVGECEGCDKLAGRTMINDCSQNPRAAFDEGVVYCDWGAERGALSTTDVDGS
jgi:hypothetical protein